MMRYVLKLLLACRNVGFKIFDSIFSKFRDPEGGKIKGINPKTLKNLLIIAATVFFLGILLIQVFSTKANIPGGLDEFRKELSPKLGIGEREEMNKPMFGNDPLSALADKNDPLFGIGGGGNGRGGSTSGSGGDSSDEERKNSLGIALDENGNPVPNVSQCLDLVDRLKNGEILTGEAKAAVDVCLDKNIAQMTAEELAAARQLARSDLSPEERELLRNYLQGKIDPDSAEGRAAKALIDALKNNDPAKAQDARNMIAALAAKNNELAEALFKKIEDEPLSEREAQLVQAFEAKMAELARAAGQGRDGVNGTSGVNGDSSAFDPNQVGGGNREAAIQNLSRDVAQREQDMKSLAEQLALAQASAARAGERLAKGLTLTPEERAAIQKLADLQTRRDALEKLQKERMAMLARHMNELNKTLTQAALTVKQNVPSGITVEIEQALNDCNNVKALPIKKRTIAKRKVEPKKEVWLTTSGESLTPDRIKMLQLLRNKKNQQDQIIADIKNPLGSKLGEKVDVNNLFEGEASIDINALTVFNDKSLKAFRLTPDMKIPAVLESQILISDQGSNQVVRVRIIDDVHNPETGVIVIPKGSIAIAQAQGFDANTGIMDLSFSNVTIGAGKTVAVNLAIGSGDGTMGLKGQVRDTRGKYLLGAFITAFTAGALNWFSQEIMQEYITTSDMGNAMLGATMQGGSNVMTQLSQQISGDLQNAARIFYVPKNIPVVLFPQ